MLAAERLPFHSHGELFNILLVAAFLLQHNVKIHIFTRIIPATQLVQFYILVIDPGPLYLPLSAIMAGRPSPDYSRLTGEGTCTWVALCVCSARPAGPIEGDLALAWENESRGVLACISRLTGFCAQGSVTALVCRQPPERPD